MRSCSKLRPARMHVPRAQRRGAFDVMAIGSVGLAVLGGATNLLGTPAMVTGRLRLCRDAGITTLQAKLGGDHAARPDTLARLVELVRQVSAEPGATTR